MMNETALGIPRLTEEENGRFRAELLNALAEQLRRYTGGQSSSVPAEIAEQVLESMLYCASVRLSGEPDPASALREIPAEELFQSGLARVKQLTEEAKAIYREALRTRIPTELIAYNVVLDGALPGFFKTYDPEYDAHENGGLTGFPDYPLLRDDRSRGGILYMKRYLEELVRENRFCAGYRKNHIRALLLVHGRKHRLDYRELIVNIPELILEYDGPPEPAAENGAV